MTLPEFLLERLDGEAVIRRRILDRAGFATVGGDYVDPHAAALVADVEAKRRIVEMHDVVDIEGNCAFCIEPAPCEHLRALALPYADHDDYDEEWKP